LYQEKSGNPVPHLHDGRVVDAGALGEDEDGQLGRILDMLLQPLRGESRCYKTALQKESINEETRKN
jgi:hypothetical protein